MRTHVSSLLWLAGLFAPLWWMLGWIQFVWLPLIVLVLLLHFARGGKVRFPLEAKVLLLFVMVQIIAVGSIQESYRYVTFAKSFWGYLTMLLLLLYASGYPNPRRLMTVVLKSLIVVILASVLVSTVTQLIWSLNGRILRFDTPFIGFVPSWIQATALGQAVFSPSAGRVDWFMGIPYLRHTAMNLFATTYSMALAAALPLLLWVARSGELGFSRVWQRMALVAFIGGVVALLLTTGRMSLLGLLLGAVWFGLVRWPRLRLVLTVMLGALIVVVALTGPEYVGGLLYARGEGSVVTRYLIYVQTWLHFLEKPIFGWGSELDVVGIGYPLGSHSQYLSVLFRFGLVGMVVWAGWMIAIWARIQRITSREARSYLGWSLVAVFVNGITDVWDLDLFTLYVLSLVFVAVLLAARSRMDKGAFRPPESNETVSAGTRGN